MTDTTFIMSLFALIFSSASLIFVIIKLGLSLGMEFVEKKENRDMKLKIEKDLKTEWEQKFKCFIDMQSQKTGNIDKEVTKKEISDLGASTRHTQVSSILLNVISKLSSNVIKYVIYLIVLTILSVLSIWVNVAFPELFYSPTEQAFSLGFGALMVVLLLLVFDILSLKSNMKNYNTLRKKFYELSEDTSLLEAKKIFDFLEREQLIYG